MNSNSSWSQALDANNTYEATLTCPVGLTALSVGAIGAPALNNIVSMAIVGADHDQGYYRVRIQGGSMPSDVTAQLVCAAVS